MTCTMPVGDNADPCRRPAVCVYVHRGDELPRCTLHDSKRVRDKAEDMGYRREPLPQVVE